MTYFLHLDRARGLGDYSLQWPPPTTNISLQFGNTVLHGGDIMPGTSVTINEMLSMGYTPDDLTSMLEQGAASGTIVVPGNTRQYGPFISIAVGGQIYGASDIVPGTGKTVVELGAQGLSEADIATMIAAGRAANSAAQAVTATAGGLPPGPSPRISTASHPSVLNSAMNWLTGSSLISGVPNFALLAGGVLAFSLISGSGRRRR